MCRCTHETSDLKLVMLFDRRKQTYCVCSHNLDAEDASQEVAELRRDGLPAFTVDQRSCHAQVDPDDCHACRTDVEHSVGPPFKVRTGRNRFAPDPTLNNRQREHDLVPLLSSRTA